MLARVSNRSINVHQRIPLAATRREVIQAGDAGMELMESLANRVPRPTQLQLGLPLAETESLDRFRDETATPGTVERLGRFFQQRTSSRGQFHFTTSRTGRWHCTNFHLANYFPVL